MKRNFLMLDELLRSISLPDIRSGIDYLCHQMSKSFHIYRSSAGSGKTFTLAKSYLTLALLRPNAFRNILGVTFTNKATEEMKRRVVDILKALASGSPHAMTGDLCEALGITEQQLTKRATETLSDILHQYGRFSVVTIDSFFHQVIRSFAREMGLQGTFTIDLDLDKVMQQVIDQMLMEIGEETQKQLKTWLTQFAESKVEEGQSWDFRRDISSLAKEILKDEFKTYAADVLKLSERAGFFDNLKKELNQVRYGFENQIKTFCKEVDDYLKREGIEVGDFTRGHSGPCGLFGKVAGNDDPKRRFEISATRRAALDDKSKWLTKANLNNAALNNALDGFLLERYAKLIRFIDEKLIDYLSALEVQRYFYTFGILAEINKYLQKYRDEKDVMLIADLPDFLHQIIQDSETPYIYEKVGSTFSHYLIDEFQDTSTFQWDNFKPLVKNATDEGKFSMVVGDVKQSIYRFRGGDWELLQNKLKSDIGDYHVQELNLDTNWRSSERLITFNNHLFKDLQELSRAFFKDAAGDILDAAMRQNIVHQVDNVFETFKDVVQKFPGHKIGATGAVHLNFIAEEETGEDEKWQDEAIARTIQQVEDLQRKGYELRDIAILTRFAREGKRVADAFIKYRNSEEAKPDLKYEVVSSEALFLTSSHVVRFIVSLIKWLNDDKNTIVLSEWLYEYLHYVRRSDRPTSQIFSGLAEWKRLVPHEFVNQREYLKTLPLYELVESIIRIFELDQAKEEMTYLQGFQDAVLDYSKNGRGDIPSFLDWWEEVRKERAIQIADQNNAIKILTIHKSKGLEFPVVIIPFLGWALDHDGTKDNILWCPGVNKSPFDALPVVPLKYTSKLANTYWAEEYFQEKLKAFLDNLNLLYVAFTRPVEALFVYTKLPKPNAKMSAINDLVYRWIQDQPQWNGEVAIYQIGEVARVEPKVLVTQEYGLDSYHSHPWRGKVSVQIKGSAELSEATFTDATLHGIQLHGLLSRIRYKADLEQFLDLPERQALTHIIEHASISDWFDEKWKVDTEVPILLPGGDFKRIDRVNRCENTTVIIDFKTGSKREKDNHQVREYMQLMSEMGYKGVKGYLVYLNDLQVVEV